MCARKQHTVNTVQRPIEHARLDPLDALLGDGDGAGVARTLFAKYLLQRFVETFGGKSYKTRRVRMQ